MGSCIGFLTVSPAATLERVYQSAESYRLVTGSREILRMAPELTISQRPVFMAMSFGINNTRLQPPFFPLGRNLDAAFAHLYCQSDSGSLIGHLPFAISHLSERNRIYSSRPEDSMCRLQFSDIVQMCLASIIVHKEAGLSTNLRSIGEQFIGLGSLPGKTFRSFLRDRFIFTRAMFLKELEDIASEGDFKNKEWQREMDLLSSSVRRSMLDDQNILPMDLTRVVSPEEALLKAQSCIAKYGAMMVHWEEISAASRQIRPSLEFLQPSQFKPKPVASAGAK